MRTDMHRRTLLACAPTLTLLLAASPSLADLIYSENFEQESALHQFYSATNTTNYSGPFTNFLGRFGNTTVGLELHAQSTGGSGVEPTHNFDLTRIFGNLDSPRPALDSGGGQGTGGRPALSDNPTLDVSTGGVVDDGLYHAGTYSLTFDLYLFDSWDGSYEVYGPDGIGVRVNGVSVFDELFDTHDPTRNFRLPDEIPGSSASNPLWNDMIYRDIEIEFTTTETMNSFLFEFIGTTTQNMNDESWGIDNIRVGSLGRSVPAPGGVTLLGAGLALIAKRRRAS